MKNRIIVLFWILAPFLIVCYVSYEVGKANNCDLSEADKQKIAIDFEKANGSWRSTLHNPCNFSPMDADKETK